MDLYLARHGETQANADGIVQGWLDTELNEIGLQQAKISAKSFNVAVDVIYSSDLKRATQTAQEFRKKFPQIPYFEDRRLRERDFGDASGQHREKHDWEVFWASKDTVSIPNAEILHDYDKRVQSFLNYLKQQDLQKILIVTHGGTINRIQNLLGVSREHTTHANASVTHIPLK